jgi:hypothetical protein
MAQGLLRLFAQDSRNFISNPPDNSWIGSLQHDTDILCWKKLSCNERRKESQNQDRLTTVDWSTATNPWPPIPNPSFGVVTAMAGQGAARHKLDWRKYVDSPVSKETLFFWGEGNDVYSYGQVP